MKGDQRVGPISKEEIDGLFASQSIQPDDLVWTDGMENWTRAASALTAAPAIQVAQTAPQAQTASPALHQPAQQAGGNIYAAPDTEVSAAPNSDIFKGSTIKKVNTKLIIGLIITAFVLNSIGGIVDVMSGAVDSNSEELTTGMIIAAIGAIPGMILYVLFFVYLYRCWKIVNIASNGQTKSTPGKAVGFLFIPAFNLYWIFVGFYGWATEYNRLLGNSNGKPVIAGLFLTYCILLIISIIPFMIILTALPMFIIWIITYVQMCKTINRHANA